MSSNAVNHLSTLLTSLTTKHHLIVEPYKLHYSVSSFSHHRHTVLLLCILYELQSHYRNKHFNLGCILHLGK